MAKKTERQCKHCYFPESRHVNTKTHKFEPMVHDGRIVMMPAR
jgi:hypothetical protein